MMTSSPEIEGQACTAGRLDRIPLGEGRKVRVAGVEIAIFRTRSGEVFAVQAECPHLGGPLADGLVLGDRVACPLHGYTFDLPSGGSVKNSCPALKTFPVEVDAAGVIRVTLPAEGVGGPATPTTETLARTKGTSPVRSAPSVRPRMPELSPAGAS
jgi:nitrite reductase (NADH) small subunit